MFWEQFYPTPDDISAKMLKKIDWKNVNTVLEPSAWKWNIIKCFKKNTYEITNHYHSRVNWFAIELDPSLRKLLNWYADLIGFDFLSFEDSLLSFDVVVMNPPFKNWVDHLLKAWDILDWWQIVCLLNEQTIKNPHSEKRKLLQKIIEDNNWEVEYLWNCFSDSERETDVWVAMVYLKKEKTRWESIFWKFEQDFLNEYKNFWDITETEIIKKWETDWLLAYNKIMKKQVVETLLSIAKMNFYKKQFSSDSLYDYNIMQNYNVSWGNLDENIQSEILKINQVSWSSFFNTTDIRSRVTRKVYNDFIKEYQESQMDFTQKNIDFVKTLIIGSAWEIHTQNILNIFDELTSYYEENRVYVEGWKTNKAWKIWMKVILPYLVELNYNNSLKASYSTSDTLRDIEKVFCTLSWKEIKTIHSSAEIYNYSHLIPNSWYEFEFFDLKFFKKWTTHFRFKDEELIKKFNYEVCKGKKWIHN